MDYEKLIDDLRSLLGQYGEKIPYGELVCAEGGYGRAGDLVWTDPEPYYIEQSADAITALLAENEKLRDEAEGMRSNWYKAVEAVKNLRAEQEKAKTEITRLKHYEDKCHDCPIVCAKTEIIKAHEELEQIQSENKRLKNKLSELAHLPFDEPGIGERTRLMAENAELRAELEQVKREREKLERFLGELEGAVYTGQYFHLRPMIEKWRGQKED